MSHTPGPWFVYSDDCVGGPFTPEPGDDQSLAVAGVACCGMRLRSNDEAAANARLIAAAPAGCELAIEIVEADEYQSGVIPSWIVKKARAFLVLATGNRR